MATILEFEIPIEEFVLEDTLAKLPDVNIEIERVVADDPDRITPYVWARADDFDALEAAIEDDPTVEDLTTLSETNREHSYQIRWQGSIDRLVSLLTRHEGTVTRATGSADGWNFRVLFPNHETLSLAHDCLQDAGFSLSVKAVYEAKDDGHIQYGLTKTQHDTLVAAFEAGYYNVPRGESLTDLAANLGLSHQALSERLRRATGTLVESTLIVGNMDGGKPPNE